MTHRAPAALAVLCCLFAAVVVPASVADEPGLATVDAASAETATEQTASPEATETPAAVAAPEELVVHYEGADRGAGRGLRAVLIAGDHEYRSEEAIPALARILAERQGMTCDVLITTDPKTGFIQPGSNHLPGTHLLDDADLLVIFARFQHLPAEQMEPIARYLRRGGPVVGLRTSTHAFQIPKDDPYARFDWRSEVPGYEGGFGRQVLGETWISHYGKNHVYSTQLEVLPEVADHPVLRGIEQVEGPDMWVEAGGYWVDPMPDSTVLARCIPIDTMTPEGQPVEGKEWCPGAWVRTYEDPEGEPREAGDPRRSGRVFNTTYGASEDLRNDPFRRLTVNACLWAAGREAEITPDLDIAFVGPYEPATFGFNRHRTQVRPGELADLAFPIFPSDRPLAPGRQRKRKR